MAASATTAAKLATSRAIAPRVPRRARRSATSASSPATSRPNAPATKGDFDDVTHANAAPSSHCERRKRACRRVLYDPAACLLSAEERVRCHILPFLWTAMRASGWHHVGRIGCEMHHLGYPRSDQILRGFFLFFFFWLIAQHTTYKTNRI